MSLSEEQRIHVWEKMLAAEVRSMYFGELASRYTKRKQMITGATFFLSSGAAATFLAKSPSYIPVAFSVISAIITAYSIAVGLDGAAARMAKLHSAWSQIQSDYEHLWSHTYDEDAEDVYAGILRKSREVSESGTEAPYDEKLIGKWQDRVEKQYGVLQHTGA